MKETKRILRFNYYISFL